jgi:hypothetical protein
MKQTLQKSFQIWLIITLLVIVSLIAIYLRNGMDGINLFIQQWPLSDLSITLASTSLTWILLGVLIHLLAYEKINRENVWVVSGFFIVIFLYLNIFRERFRYGDYHYYLEAAIALANGQTLPDTYLYLPLWATLIQFLVPLGDSGVLTILWILNIFALSAFYFLLIRILQRYNFSQHLATAITILFLLINTPLLRTLGFVQVNLLVIDLILLSLLTYPKNNFLSALTLALAIHLKTSPAVLVLAFLLEFNWKWLIWFAITFILIGLFPIAINGTYPYFDYINNAIFLTQIPDTNFHDTSFDSFLRFLNPFLGIQIEQTRIIVLLMKVLLLITALIVMAKTIKQKSFSQENKMLNAVPSLFILMMLASPIVWDHHGIFVTLSFLLLFKRIDNPNHWLIFAFAYFFEFMLPSFDFFPWSYGRLLAPLIILYLIWQTSNNKEPSQLTTNSNHWFAKLTSK